MPKRAFPKHAPTELFALRHWGRRQSQISQEKKDSELLRQLAAQRDARSDTFKFALGLDVPFEPSSAPNSRQEHGSREPPAPTFLAPYEPEKPGNKSDQASEKTRPDLPANFSIPTFKPRLK